MLLSQSEKRACQVAVVTRNPLVTRLLTGILVEWKFNVCDDVGQAEIIFVERGLAAPETVKTLCWLSPMPVGDDLFVEVPISLSRLYSMLEQTLFPSPRRHIRVSMDELVDIQLENTWLPAQLISLSDRGGRLAFERELPTGTPVAMAIKLNGRELQLPTEVLYTVPAGDTAGRSLPHIGFQFKPLDDQVCKALRQYIEWMCVERVCNKERISRKDPSVSWFALARDPWAELSTS